MVQAVAMLGDSRFASILTNSAKYTRLVLRKQLWIWPVLAAFLLLGVGWFIRGTVENAIKTNMADDLRTILDADLAGLQIWLRNQESEATALADSDDVRDAVVGLTDVVRRTTDPENIPRALIQAAAQDALRKELKPQLATNVYCGFVLFGLDGRVLAADRDDVVGQTDHTSQTDLIRKVMAGKAVVTRPIKSHVLLRSATGEVRAGVPTMFAAAPVYDRQKNMLAVLALRIRPEDDFTRILAVGRSGVTGETFAFDANGLLLSMSRFDDELKQVGLLPDDEQVQSILNLEIRDPQVNMMEGRRPDLRRREQPLTRMAADAVEGNSGVDVDGYRDYRGVPVIGAWTWLPEQGFGVATEMNMAEAYRPVNILRWAFWGLFALLALGAIAIFTFTVIVSRLNRSLRKEALKAQRLGQYALEEQLGAGGMGVVYRAQHMMLRRPTAVKLLNIDKMTDASIARFEREVQLTSQLTHPNTIAVYDYGRTPEGIFYYAMEYLDGISLDQLVERFGPQPEARVVQIIRQVCGSLAEAHAAGLIHRDIKPANIMFTQRGGIPDVVKVLDFGLVKTVDGKHDISLSASGAFAGTPLYLSPEAFQGGDKVDPRSDLYAVGAVAYFLLTGTPPFQGKNIVEVCMNHVNQTPDRLADRLKRPVSEDLENLILRCLAKEPAERPQTADEVADAFERCKVTGTWTKQDAIAWWHQPETAERLHKSPTPTGGSSSDETIAHDCARDGLQCVKR